MQIAEYTRAPEYRRMPTDTKPKARTRAVERRKALGMTQNTLSARSGVPQPTISRFEAGDEVLPDTVRAIVAALGTTAAWINGETDDSSPVAEPLPAQHMLSEAIGRAFDARRHSTADIRAVEDTLSSLVGLTDALSDLDAAARAWLDAAAYLRQKRLPVTVTALLVRVTGELTRPRPDLNAEGDRQLRALGGEPPPESTKIHG